MDIPVFIADFEWGHMDGGWAIAMMLGMLLFWALVIVLVVWLVRGAVRGHLGGTEKLAPLEVLERRYAEGAITTEEYRERRETLSSTD